MDKRKLKGMNGKLHARYFVAKIGLFKISRESKIEVYNCGEPHISPHAARETRKERRKASWQGYV